METVEVISKVTCVTSSISSNLQFTSSTLPVTSSNPQIQ